MTTTETGPVTEPGPAGAADVGRPPRSRQGLRALIARLHFYAGVFVAPFLFVAALTGLLYAFTPQLDQLLYGDWLTVEQVGDAPRPLAEQVEAARAAHPEGALASVVTPPGPEDTTRVVFSSPEWGETQHTVFVDPYTAQTQGELTTWWGATPVTTWLDEFHRSLHLGTYGTLYSELAASWLWVVVAGGLVLWTGRSRGQRAAWARGVLLPDRSAGGVRRTRGLHAATGVWLALGLFFLSATGLTWSDHAGARFDQAVDAVRGQAPVLDTSLPGSAGAGGDGGEHSGHGGGAGDAAAADPAGFGTALRTARDAGLGGTVVVTPPAREGTVWTVAQSDNVWPVHYDSVAVDVAEGEVTDRTRWTDHPLVSKQVVAAVGWALPLLGVTLPAFLLLDAAVGALRVRRS
jgi:uncharacterized iron-regulated membrane protein